MMRAFGVAAGFAALMMAMSPAGAAEPVQASSPIKGPRVTVAPVRFGDVVEKVHVTGTLTIRGIHTCNVLQFSIRV